MTDPSTMEPLLRIRLLGQFEIRKDDQQVDLPTRNAEALLSYLILNPGVHSREKVAALFWGEVADSKARASLRNELATLRRLVDKSLLITSRETVGLNPSLPLWVDTQALEQSLQAVTSQETISASGRMADLYRGDLLEGFYEDWILLERDRLREEYIRALLELTQHARSRSEYESATDFATRVLALDPARERAHQHLMFCHLALGDRDAALRQFEDCQTALQQHLAVGPSPETRGLWEWIQHAPAQSGSLAARITNLPAPLGSFVGREQEIAEIKQLFDAHRLVTLTGTGGIGKTRLAIQAATDMLDRFPDGVWWVDLTAISTPDLLPQALGKALGLQEARTQSLEDTVLEVLGPKVTLLILDNCEHLLNASAHWTRLILENGPDLKVLVTSREPLRIPGEHVRAVPPLSLPESSVSATLEAISSTESTKLFSHRAQAARSDFELSSSNASQVAEICIQLDGIPLAIELAAPLVRSMSVTQMVERLANDYDLPATRLAGPASRHQTLDSAIAWSHDLLPDQERALFRRLAVFSGDFTQAAAEALYRSLSVESGHKPESTLGHSPEDASPVQLDALADLTEGLTHLVEASLLHISLTDPDPRYLMLNTIRKFAEERLMESGESTEMRQRHHQYYVDFAVSVEPHLGFFLPDSQMLSWVGRFDLEQDNLRAALDWSMSDPFSLEDGLRLAASLHWYWFLRGQFTEGRAWLRDLLASSGQASNQVRAHALLGLGYLACWRGEFEAAVPDLHAARDVFADLGDRSGVAFSTIGLGFANSGIGQEERAADLIEDGLQLAREIEDRWLASFSLHFLGTAHSYQELFGQAIDALEGSIREAEAMGGNIPGVGYSHFHLGRIARIRGDYSDANHHLSEAIRHFHPLNEFRGVAYVFAELSALFQDQGQPEVAARLGGAMAALQRKLGPLLEEALQTGFEQSIELAKHQLGPQSYRSAFESGHQSDVDENIAFALERQLD